MNSGMISGDVTNKSIYKGIRRRKWGKWVSEIRVPGTQERLWLGTYTMPEAAAVAHDVALYCLRGKSSASTMNFPLMLPPNAREGMSPKSVQKAASDAGMAIDAHMITNYKLLSDINDVKSNNESNASSRSIWEDELGEHSNTKSEAKDGEFFGISIEDYLLASESDLLL